MFAWIKKLFSKSKPVDILISINKISDERGEHIELWFAKSVRPSEYIALINDILSRDNLTYAADLFEMQGNKNSAEEIQDSITAKYLESTKETIDKIKNSYLNEEVIKPSKGIIHE
jgi:hypothetical protein